MSAATAFQTEVYAALATACSPTPVSAHPLPGQVLPYVTLGETDGSDDPGGERLSIYVHTWSSKEGPHEVKALQETIRATLHASERERDGWKFTSLREVDVRTFLDVDGQTWHGVQRFSALAD